MQHDNKTAQLRREMLIRLAKLYLDGKLSELDRMPLELRPRKKESTRCCVYRDRAILKYRCMALLGIAVE
ncbi:MAG: Fe-hydrogenase large subunit family protein, partial [Bacteroidota bacterium]